MSYDELQLSPAYRDGSSGYRCVMSYYRTPHQRRLERLLLPWFLVGTLVATHVAISWSERGAVDYRPEPQHWSRIEMPAPPMFR